MSDLTKADLRERLGNIDQIRDILIGPQLREYSNRLEQLERNLASVQQEFRGRSEEVRQSVLAELQTAVETIDKKIRTLILKDEEEKFDIRQQIDAINKRIATTAEDLQESVSSELDELAENADKRLKSILAKDEEEKFDLRQQIDLLSKRMTGNIEALDEALDTQTTALHENFQETRTKLQDEITDLRTQLFEELERYCSMLSQVKISRDDMAELLFELGLRLKGSEFVPELREVADTISEPRSISEPMVTPLPTPEPTPVSAPESTIELTAKAPTPSTPRAKSETTSAARRGRMGRLK
ncbi:MAG: hypothetical protein ACOYME_08765 [Prochlorotrichaceae cyanobacterium]